MGCVLLMMSIQPKMALTTIYGVCIRRICNHVKVVELVGELLFTFLGLKLYNLF